MYNLHQAMAAASSELSSASWSTTLSASAKEADVPVAHPLPVPIATHIDHPVRLNDAIHTKHLSQRNLQQCSEQHEYVTAFNQNTGVSPIAGMMFYASSRFEPITIETMELDVRSEFIQNFHVLVYTTDETYYNPTSATDDGVYNNPEAWTLVANTTLIPHPSGERALIPTNDFTNIPLESLEKKAFFIKLQGPWLDHTLQALIKDGELAYSGDYMSVFAGSPVNTDNQNPGHIFPVDQLDRSANPIFAGKFYFSTQRECNGQQAAPRNIKTTVEFILVTDVQLSAQDYDNIEVDMENLFQELIETDTDVAGLASNHDLKLAEPKALMRSFTGQCVPDWTQCLALVVQLDLQYKNSVEEGEVLAQIYKQSPAFVSKIADTLPDKANWFDIGLKGVETAFELTFSGSFAAQQLDDVQIDFLHQGIVDFVGQHVFPQYVQVLTMDVKTQAINGQQRRDLAALSSLRPRNAQATTTLMLQGTLMGAQFSLEEPLQFANRINEAFTNNADQFVPSLAFNLNLPGPINEGNRMDFFQGVQDIDVFIDVGQERPSNGNDVYDGTLGSGVGSDDPSFPEGTGGGETDKSYVDGNLKIIVISVGAAVAVIAICVAGYCLYRTAFKNPDDDINDGFTREEIRKRKERQRRREERKALKAAAAANGEDPTLATSTGHTLDTATSTQGRRPARSVATTTASRSIFSGDTEDEDDYPPGWGSESNDEEEGEAYQNEFIEVEGANNMSSPLTPSPKSKVSKKKAGPPNAPSLNNSSDPNLPQGGPPAYTIDGLRQMGIGKLVRIANEYGIAHDPTLVVEKEDMVQVMVNSGKLPMAYAAQPFVQEESLPPNTYTLQELRAMHIHDLRQLLQDLEVDYNERACVEKEDLIRVLYYCGKITIVRQAPRQPPVTQQAMNEQDHKDTTEPRKSKRKKGKRKQNKESVDGKKRKSKSKSKKDKDSRKSKRKAGKKSSSQTRKQAERRVSLVAALGWSRGSDPPEQEPEPVVVYPSTKASPKKAKKKSVSDVETNASSKRRGSIIAAFGWFRTEQAESADEDSSSGGSSEDEDTFESAGAPIMANSMIQQPPNNQLHPHQDLARPIPIHFQQAQQQMQQVHGAPSTVRRASVATPGRPMPQYSMMQQQPHMSLGNQPAVGNVNGAGGPPVVRRASVATPGRPLPQHGMMVQQPNPFRQSGAPPQVGQVRRASVANPGRQQQMPPIQQRMPPSHQQQYHQPNSGMSSGVPLRRVSLATPGRPMVPQPQAVASGAAMQPRAIAQGGAWVPQPQGVPLRRASANVATGMQPTMMIQNGQPTRNFQQMMPPSKQQEGVRRASVATAGIRVNNPVPPPQGGVPLRRASVSTTAGMQRSLANTATNPNMTTRPTIGGQQPQLNNKAPSMPQKGATARRPSQLQQTTSRPPVAASAKNHPQPKEQPVPAALRSPRPSMAPSTITSSGGNGKQTEGVISPLNNDGWSPLKQHPKVRAKPSSQKPTVPL